MGSGGELSATAGPEAVLPQADLYVADLAALGLAHGSEAAATRLLQLLQNTPAVLLVSAHDRSWSALPAVATRPSLVWLAKPYGTQAMQAALERAAADYADFAARQARRGWAGATRYVSFHSDPEFLLPSHSFVPFWVDGAGYWLVIAGEPLLNNPALVELLWSLKPDRAE